MHETCIGVDDINLIFNLFKTQHIVSRSRDQV